MANVIQRIVRLVLDKKAALKTEADAKRALGGIDKGLMVLKRAALAFGAALVAAMSLRVLSAFGKAAVREARNAQKVWNDLRGTIEATGTSFASLETRLRNMAAAFQDATTIGDEEFAEGLTRMISLTGDVEASINNMGLAADVAAQFFNGELGPAVELVSKVSTGYTQQLRRMGIAVDSAQEGLDVLAERSLGAAARQMETLDGQTRRLDNAFGDFLESIGMAIIAGGEETGVLQTLTGAIQSLTTWVEQNQEALSRWVVNGFRFVVIAADGVYRGLKGLGLLVVGPFMFQIGLTTSAVGGLAKAFLTLFDVITAAPRFLGARAAALIGLDGVANTLDNLTDSLHNTTDAIMGFGVQAMRGGLQTVGEAMRTFANRTGPANALLNPSPGGPSTFRSSRGQVASGTPTEEGAKKEKKEVDAVTKALQQYEEQMRVAHGMQQLLGSEFDFTGAKVSALESLLQSLLAAGMDPASIGLQTIAQDLQDLRVVIDPVSDAIMALDEEFQNIDTMLSVFGENFDATTAKMGALESAIQSLILEGFDASDPVMQHYIQQWMDLLEVQRQAEEQAADYALAVDTLSSVIVGAIGGELAIVAKAKAKANLLLAAEQVAHGVVSLLNPLTAIKAKDHFAAAAKFGAIAAGWAALGAATGGGGSGALAGGRGASGGASESAEPPGPDISIYLTGDMNALDPRVQKWVAGAQEQYNERKGNATVRVVPVRR